MRTEGKWGQFRKAAIEAHELLASGLSELAGAPASDVEQSHRVLTIRLLFMLAAAARGLLDIPDWKKSPRPFLQNLIRWAKENPPYMRRIFAFCDLFEPVRQPQLWRFRPSEQSLKLAVEALLETDPSSWDPCWPGDVYPMLVESSRRKEMGIFFTPWPAADFIVEQALGPLCYAQGEKKKRPRDEKELLQLKIVDPAMGGGRFVVSAADYISRAIAEARGEAVNNSHRKLAAERIYGVDRDPIAVDIARISLWLFIGGPERPWDYLRNHLKAGDSLIGATLSEIEGAPAEQVENPDQLALFKREPPKRETPPLASLAESGRTARLDALADLWTAAVLEVERAAEEFPLALLSLSHVSDEKWNDLEGKPGFQEARRVAKRLGFFHWETRFPSVFLHGEKQKRGFDAVIGNPPYRKERGSGANQPVRLSPIARKWGESKIDLLSLFIHRGLDLLRPGGRLSFITSSYWIKAEGASRLRRRIALDESFHLYVDLASHPVFDSVSGRHGILVASRGASHVSPCRVLRIKPEKIGEEGVLESLVENPKESFTEEVFLDQREILDGAGLFNIADRAADIICRKMEETGVPLGDIARTSQGIVENPPELTQKIIAAVAETSPQLVEEEGYEPGEAVFLLPPNHQLIGALGELERKFLRPYYRPSSIRRFYIPEKPDGFLLYLTPQNCPDITEYPWLREHLSRYRVFTEERREVKEGRISWWHLHWPREEELFEGEHVLMPQMVDAPRAARADRQAYVGMSVQVIAKSEGVSMGFLTAVLNSRAVEFYLVEGGRAKERGAKLDISLETLRRIPVPKVESAEKSNQKKLDELLKLYREWIEHI